MNNPNQNCVERAEAIDCLAAGFLSKSEEAELRQHLEECAFCREAYQRTQELTVQLESAAIDISDSTDTLIEGALQAIEPAKSKATPPVSKIKPSKQLAERNHWAYLQTAIVFLVGLGLGLLLPKQTPEIKQPNEVNKNVTDESSNAPPNHIVRSDVERLLESDEVLLIDRDTNGDVHWRRYDFTEANRNPDKNCLVPVSYSDGSQQFVLAQVAYAACGIAWEEIIKQKSELPKLNPSS